MDIKIEKNEEEPIIYSTFSDGSIRSINYKTKKVELITKTGYFLNMTDKEIDEKCNRDENEHICGRPLGIKYNKISNSLFFIDAYHGLFEYNLFHKNITQLVKTTDDPFQMKFLNHLDFYYLNNHTFHIYFTDSSSKFQRRFHIDEFFENRNYGRLFFYDSNSKKIQKVLDNLSFPNGVSFSSDHNYLFVSITNNFQILRYHLNGFLKGWFLKINIIIKYKKKKRYF
jgi:sugar lactone lactonase YvrE